MESLTGRARLRMTTCKHRLLLFVSVITIELRKIKIMLQTFLNWWHGRVESMLASSSKGAGFKFLLCQKSETRLVKWYSISGYRIVVSLIGNK